MNLSVVVITKNSGETLERCLLSVCNLADEIILIDDSSTDSTVAIGKQFNAQIYDYRERNLGAKRAFGLEKATREWVLAIDADEIVSPELLEEIKQKLSDPKIIKGVCGYIIPFKNHFLGKPVRYGGEQYKMLRLFRRSLVRIEPSLVHEHFIVDGHPELMEHHIHHYSYRTLGQMYRKFTNYAVREAQQKAAKGEWSSWKKVLLYPPHMFYARFIEDFGYKDGIFRIPLDIGFAYMEFLTYFLLFIYTIRRSYKTT